ncbi:MAG: hypothetical protein EOP86_02275, partial [Verrucomicrobiaceae bacterium]
MKLPPLCLLLMGAMITAPLAVETSPSPPLPPAGPVVDATALPLPLPEPPATVLLPPPVNPGPATAPVPVVPAGPPVSAEAVSAGLLAEPAAAPAASPPPPLSMPALPADGWWVEAVPLNEVFQYLARKAGVQYFHNNTLATPEYQLTGHLRSDDPRQQMEDVALVFGLTIYHQGSTVFAMTDQQLARLPVEVMSYPLKYLRGSRPSRSSGGAAAPAAEGGEGGESGGGLADFEKLKAIMRPMLTKGVGQIEFEEKTNTLLVTDNSIRLKKLRALLEKIDRPKQQIAVNVRVLRVSGTQGKKAGVDWSALGNGISVSTSQSLNALFNLPDTSVGTRADTITQLSVGGVDTESVQSITNFNSSFQDGSGLVFSPLQVQAIIRALENKDFVSQEACPTIITEDNEQGIISVVDRFPIITSSVSETNAGQNTADQVRYKIDEKDPDAMETPEKSREIGVTLSVTPTLLPDGTVRMKLRPRVAKIVELVPGKNGTFYPRVSESTAEAISRIPSGKSLILGGFYDYSTI